MHRLSYISHPLPCSNQIYNLPASALKLHSGTIQGQPEESPFNLFAVDLEMNEASEHEKLPIEKGRRKKRESKSSC